MTFLHALEKLWSKRPKSSRTILKVGMAFSDFVSERDHTGSLFAAEDKSKSLYSTLDRLNARFGRQAVYFASAHKARDRSSLHIAFNHIPDPGNGEVKDLVVIITGGVEGDRRRARAAARPKGVKLALAARHEPSSWPWPRSAASSARRASSR
jgi:hypothetical protein